MPSASHKIAYRPDIDGLRAIAVLGVVFFHAGLGFPGGYVGVDVFFVISGFLITSLLLKELRQGTFSLLNFWERRARRILPALAVVVAAIIAAGWFFLLPADYEVLGKQVIALVAFSSNIKLWLETGYFAAAAETKPLLHTWSLSLEEQFYLLIPLLLAFLFRIRKSNWIARILLLGALVSFGLSVYGSYRAPAATFFLLPTRAWELAAGSMLAFVPPIPQPRLRTLAAWLGLIAILGPFFFYAPGIRFPGLTALPPVAGAALLIWSGLRPPTSDPRLPTSDSRPPIPNRLLSSRPFVWIGLLSYSLYLWHWPLFAFQKYISETPASLPLRLSLVAASVILAVLSWRFVETPFRKRQWCASRKAIFAFGAGASSAVVALGAMLYSSSGFPRRMPADAQCFANAKSDRAFIHELTTTDVLAGKLIPFGASQPGTPVKWLVWGDSHAMAALPAFDTFLKERGLSGSAATHSSTAPVLDYSHISKYSLGADAVAFNDAVFAHLKAHRISNVVLIGRWSSYTVENPLLPDDHPFESSLIATVQKIIQAGSRPWILLEVPNQPFDVPRILARYAFHQQDIAPLCAKPDANISSLGNHPCLVTQLQEAGAYILDPRPAFLSEDRSHYVVARQGTAIYCDSHHLSTRGAEMILLPLLRASISADSPALLISQ